MAIIKTKTLPNGATGNYWRIMDILIDRQTLTAHATLALFKDQATSNSGAPPLGGIKRFRFSYQMSDLVNNPNLVAFIYAKILVAANVLHSIDISGAPLETPVPADPDIYDGVPG